MMSSTALTITSLPVSEPTALNSDFLLPHPSPTAIDKELDEGGVLSGQLTQHDATRPVQLDLLPAHCTADACLIEARGELHRSDFGMHGHHTLLSDRVELALSIAIVRTPD